MVIGAFSIGKLPRIEFGEGSFEKLPALVAAWGQRALLVTGARSFRGSPRFARLLEALEAAGISSRHLEIGGEPSPADVDAAVARFHPEGVDVVLAVGGGSVLDAAKAVAALLPRGNSVLDHLEGVGRDIPYQGPSLPCVAVPTTAGTGSEATRNAVLSARGRGGFKKSFRHEALMPVCALLDPDLLASCPAPTIAGSGIDALTQLIESYTSLHASRPTDALCLDALAAAKGALLEWHARGAAAREARSAMAYAALVSGIALSQAGLGAVHGLASPLGAFFPVPHGLACGTLLAETIRANSRAMRAREPQNPALEKYARLGTLLNGREAPLEELLGSWSERLAIPRLAAYGVRDADLDAVVGAARPGSMRTNPIVLTDRELREVLERRL